MSSKSIRKCYVPECEDKTSPRHRFPSKKELLDVWVKRINSPKLFNMTVEKIASTARVCESHFAPMNLMGRNKPLLKGSVPTLKIPGYNEEPSKENCFYFSTASTSSESTVTTATETSTVTSQVIAVPGTSKDFSPEVKLLKTTPSKRKTYIAHPGKIKQKLQDIFETEINPSADIEEGFAPLPEEEENIVPPSHSVIQDVASRPSTSPKMKKQSKLKRRHRQSVLRRINIKRSSDLTPDARKIFHSLQYLQRQNRRLERCNASGRQRLKFMQNILDKEPLVSLKKHLNNTTYNFMLSQIKMQKRKPKGRRYTLDDKIFALSMLKQSPSGYRLLRKIFSIPSTKTLRNLLNKIPYMCGSNEHILNNLKMAAACEKDKNNLYCTLVFDEMSLQSGLQYNKKFDCVEGFVDMGGVNRQFKFADHVLVFMLRGIKRKWKQPLSFFFCAGTTSTVNLVRLIKENIRNVRSAGFHVIATICDQGATNQAAINYLFNETKELCLSEGRENTYGGYLIDSVEVFHLYDFPHLLKGIRNNMLRKNLCFSENKVAKWSHIVQLYENDKEEFELRACPKLTAEHVLPEKIRKMKVSCCTQVFSQRVAAALNLYAKLSTKMPLEHPQYINPEASQTAEMLLFLDKLFDSVNGSSTTRFPQKELKTAISLHSKHLSFWHDEAIPMLSTISFFCPQTHQKSVPPSIKNWISSLRNLECIWKYLSDNGFKFLIPRNLNQDPLENFFGCIRSHGRRNINPTCTSFISSFKALLINNFLSSHSVNANCEEDESEGAFTLLKEFVSSTVPPDLKLPNIPASTFNFTEESMSSAFGNEVLHYVGGFVIKKIKQTNNNCLQCLHLMGSHVDTASEQHGLINARRYKFTSRLLYPSTLFVFHFKSILKILTTALPNNILRYGLKEYLCNAVREGDNFPLFKALFCVDHSQASVDAFINGTVNLFLFTYIKNINKILCGKDLRSVQTTQDPVKKLAFEKYKKTRK